MTHELKCWPAYFKAVHKGQKTWELRRDDRNFQVGDTVDLSEWDPEIAQYTGRALVFKISYILRNAEHFGLQPGYCILSLV